jgi:hypothetical protein
MTTPKWDTTPRSAVVRRATTTRRAATHRRREHTRTINGQPVRIRQATVHTTHGQRLADAGRRAVSNYQALTAPGPGRARYAGKVSAGVGAVVAIGMMQVASGVTAVAVGVLAALGSMLLAAFLPKHMKRRWWEPRFWHRTRRHLRAARLAARPHVERGRSVAQRARQATRPPRKEHDA